VAALAISEFRRLIVKVGSSLLVDADGRLNRDWLETLAHDVGALQKQGHEILIVSSGAIAIGSLILGINKRRARLEDLQAAAAAGQVQLVHAYQEVLGQHGIAAAQILLGDFSTRGARSGGSSNVVSYLSSMRMTRLLPRRSVTAITTGWLPVSLNWSWLTR
jgi:glutamate 5-kinase